MRKGLSIALFIAVVLGAFLSVLAQEPVADILAAATAAAQRYPHADAVYLRSDVTVKIDPAGNIRDTIHNTLYCYRRKKGSTITDSPCVSSTSPPSRRPASITHGR